MKLTGSASGGTRRDGTWATDYGSSNHKDQSFHTVQINVTSPLRKPQRVQVETFWITRNEAGGPIQKSKFGDQKVADGGNLTVVVSADGNADHTDDKYVALGAQEKTGNKYLGWTARALNGEGQVIAVTSSMPYLEAYEWK